MCRVIQLGNEILLVMDSWGQWGLILTKFFNGCELNLGVFRSAWISEMLNVCFILSFWTEFVFLVVYDV